MTIRESHRDYVSVGPMKIANIFSAEPLTADDFREYRHIRVDESIDRGCLVVENDEGRMIGITWDTLGALFDGRRL